MGFVTHIECTICGRHHDATRTQAVCEKCGQMLAVRYDLERVKRAVTKDALRSRPPGMYRFRELTPLADGETPVTLGEGGTPLLPLPRLAAHFGMRHLWGKDEGQNPTQSFKARGMTAAVSMAKELGARKLAVPSAGNAAGALAAYAARGGLEAHIFMPKDTPRANVIECEQTGANVTLMDGLITDCGAEVGRRKEAEGWFDVSTLKEPYRIEGKKTMGLELAEQQRWRLPDVILYPTGGGTGLVGMWKAFAELRELGWLREEKLPRLISCQSTGCAPIVRAFEKGERFAELFPNAHTIASGLRVPAAVGDFMMLDAIRESGGCALCGREERIVEWMRRAMSLEGVSLCPESAVCLDALETLVADGRVRPDERVVVFNTGAAQKYPEAVPLTLPRLDVTRPVDYLALNRP